jgi:hypothetical protein
MLNKWRMSPKERLNYNFGKYINFMASRKPFQRRTVFCKPLCWPILKHFLQVIDQYHFLENELALFDIIILWSNKEYFGSYPCQVVSELARCSNGIIQYTTKSRDLIRTRTWLNFSQILVRIKSRDFQPEKRQFVQI